MFDWSGHNTHLGKTVIPDFDDGAIIFAELIDVLVFEVPSEEAESLRFRVSRPKTKSQSFGDPEEEAFDPVCIAGENVEPAERFR